MIPQQNHIISIDCMDAGLIGRLTKKLGAEAISVNCKQLNIIHDYKSTKLLRAEGYDVPAPILSQYKFPVSDLTKPAFQVQKWTSAMLTMEARGYVLNGLGTGKTRCVLWAFDYLRSIGFVNKLLAICPLSAVHRTWGKELIEEFPWLKFEILHGTKNQRLKKLAKNVDVYIINHDGVQVLLDELMGRKDIDCVCADEVATYRNGGTKRTKKFKQLSMVKGWVWGLTGSPIPRAVTDVWGPCSAITPSTVPNSFTDFRAQLSLKKGPYTWVPKHGAEEYAVSCMRPSVRYRLDEIVELPEQVQSYYEAPLSSNQLLVYEAMQDKAIALIGEKKIDAMNAGAVLSKLLQIALGYVYSRDGTVMTLDNTPRLQLIIDLIDSSEHKVIMFAPFKSAINAFSGVLTANEIEHCIVTGDVTLKERNIIFTEFQDTPKYKVMLAHPACMAHALTLTKATTTIWTGPVTSLDTFSQANARTYRIGQEHRTLIAMVGGTPAERRIYQILGRNEKLQNNFLKLVELLTLKNEAN
jgi:SNF2 family DNA or RNA helicase